MPVVAGLLLAAGAGRRMGRPKALVELDGEALVTRATRALTDAGLGPVVVVLGAGAEQAAPLVGEGAQVVVAEGWDEGMGASLRAGLAALRPSAGVDAVLVSLVDTPGIGAAALRRVAGAAAGPGTVARGAFDGRPSHPVLLGRAHWDAVEAVATGDEGARSFLRGRAGVDLIEVSDVARAGDLDTPDDLNDA